MHTSIQTVAIAKIAHDGYQTITTATVTNTLCCHYNLAIKSLKLKLAMLFRNHHTLSGNDEVSAFYFLKRSYIRTMTGSDRCVPFL